MPRISPATLVAGCLYAARQPARAWMRIGSAVWRRPSAPLPRAGWRCADLAPRGLPHSASPRRSSIQPSHLTLAATVIGPSSVVAAADGAITPIITGGGRPRSAVRNPATRCVKERATKSSRMAVAARSTAPARAGRSARQVTACAVSPSSSAPGSVSAAQGARSAARGTPVVRPIASASRAVNVAPLVRCARPVVAYVARWLASARLGAYPRRVVPG
jgi:hypothetical protein